MSVRPHTEEVSVFLGGVPAPAGDLTVVVRGGRVYLELAGVPVPVGKDVRLTVLYDGPAGPTPPPPPVLADIPPPPPPGSGP